MMSLIRFFENATGFVSATFYTRKVNCPSRTNSGMGSALFTIDSRSKTRARTERPVHGSWSGDCGRWRFGSAVGLAPLVPIRDEETQRLWYAEV
jgi:hypothetical protein